jgi:hypothetical protein
VPDEVIQDVKRDTIEFFKLPLEAKKVHAQVPGGLEGYGQAFVFSETQKLDHSHKVSGRWGRGTGSWYVVRYS